MPAVDHPWALLLLLACVPALLGSGGRWRGVASLAAIPRDRASAGLDGALRGVGVLAVATMVAGIAGLHDGPASVARTGVGAHVVVVLDRSLSMDEAFAVRGEKGRESKSVAAARLLAAFFAQRPHDVFGVVAFSTSPIPAMPLTAHRDAVAASIAAMARPGLANTDIGAGIAMGLAQFDRDPPGAARALLLVSDGAGAIDEATRAYIRTAEARSGAHLYYLYLRAGDDPPLAEAEDESHNLERPAGLDTFFRSLGADYHGFEARDAGAVEAATRRIGALETHPITYREPVPRREWDGICYCIAACCLAILMLAQAAERTLSPVRLPR